MNTSISKQVYDSLCGELLDEYRIKHVENAFAEGSPCDVLYQEITDAYARLCERLGKEDDDEDVEVIINAFMEMNRILCLKMFSYGVLYGTHSL